MSKINFLDWFTLQNHCEVGYTFSYRLSKKEYIEKVESALVKDNRSSRDREAHIAGENTIRVDLDSLLEDGILNLSPGGRGGFKSHFYGKIEECKDSNGEIKCDIKSGAYISAGLENLYYIHLVLTGLFILYCTSEKILGKFIISSSEIGLFAIAFSVPYFLFPFIIMKEIGRSLNRDMMDVYRKNIDSLFK